MSAKTYRRTLSDGSFLSISVYFIKRDNWRPHGVKYRYSWIQNGKCRVLFDNHHGKGEHLHIDGKEVEFRFESFMQLRERFITEVRKLGGAL